MEGWLDGSRACHHCPSLGCQGSKGSSGAPPHGWRRKVQDNGPSSIHQAPSLAPRLHRSPPTPPRLAAVCFLRSTRLDSTDTTTRTRVPPTTGTTTFPPSNDGTALQLFAAAHRLPGHIGSHDFVSHIRPGNGDVFPSALGPIPLRFFGRPPYTSRGCRRPLPYYWTSTVWVPGLLISLRLVHGGVSAGTLPRPPPLLGPHASQRDWKCGLGSWSTGGCRYCLAPSHETGLTFRDCRRLFPIPSTPTCRFSQLGSASDIPTEHGFSSRSRGLKSSSPDKPWNGVRNGQWGPAKTQAPIVSVASPAHSGRLDILPLRPAYLLRC